jgi:hypothetical protein
MNTTADPAAAMDGAVRGDIEVFVPPSREAVWLVRQLPGLFAPHRERVRWYTRVLGFLVVAPFTQFTLVSFELQAFLFRVFHTRLAARIGHALFMPMVNFFVMVALAGVRAGPHPASHGWPGPSINGAVVYACVLVFWYFTVAWGERLLLWWILSAAGTLALAFGADCFYCHTFTLDPAARSFFTPSPAAASPFLWMTVGALLLALSHTPEPRLPPRVSDAWKWTEARAFLFGTGDRPHSIGRFLGRLLLLAVQVVTGTINEWWASPRLMPYNLLLLMFSAGYRPDVAQRTRAYAERALASGNPAVDFVGIGGGAFLSVDDRA